MAIATRTASCRSSAGDKFRSLTKPRILSRASMNSLSSLACSGQLIARVEGEHIRHLLKTARGKVSSRRTKSKHYFSPYLRSARCAHSVATDSDDLAGLHPFELREALGNQRQQVFQQDRLPTKNDNRDLSSLQILLVFKSAIDGEDNVEFCSLGRAQELTVLKSSKPGVSRRLTIMPGKAFAQPLVHALVKKNPHSRLGGQKLLRLLERRDHHLSRNGGVAFDKLFERVPSFQGVEQQLKGDSRPAKDRRSTQNIGIFDDDTIRGTHGRLQSGQYITAGGSVSVQEAYV